MHPGTTLTDAIRSWATPRALSGGPESAERKQELGRTNSGGGDLQSQAKEWPTPAATVINDRESPESFNARAEKWKGTYNNSKPLTIVCKEWSSPPVQKRARSGNSSIHSSTPRSKAKTKRLSPLFVEWLMGLPLWWTLPCSFEWTD
jgi:hypothetical protein